jgi:twinkle protein
MNAAELSRMMAENVTPIVEHLLPQGKKVGKEWKAGSVAGESGQSLSVCLAGSKRGTWKDFATGDGGDMLNLWAQCRCVSVADAMRDAKAFLGVRDQQPTRPRPAYQRPEKPKGTAPKAAVRDWLLSRGLTAETIAAFKVASSKDDDAIIFPFLRDGDLVNAKHLLLKRDANGKKMMWQEKNAEPCLFGWDLIDPSERVIAIAEGEIDAMTLHQMGMLALSVNAGTLNHQWIDSDWERLERFSEIFLCYDADEAGQKGAKEVANRLGLDRCRVVTFPKKDANEYLQAGATADDFRRCMAQARTLDPEELCSIASFWPGVKALFYPSRDQIANPVLCFCGQKQPWFAFRPAELTVWTGYSGHGKSLMLNQIMLGVMEQGERVCVFSGEMTAEQQGKRMAKQLGGTGRPTSSYLDAMGDWLRERMWLFNLVGTASIDRLLSVFAYGYKRYGIRHFVVDSLMTTDVLEDGAGALTSQKEAVRKLAAFARMSGVHVHLVAHPRKGQDERRSPGKMDVSGSSKLTDAADNVFSVWSAQKEDGDPAVDEPDAYLELLKNRNGETQHRKLALFFNRECMQFSISPRRAPHVHVPFTLTSELTA